MKKELFLSTSLLLAAWQVDAASPVTITAPNGQQAGVESNGAVDVNISSGNLSVTVGNVSLGNSSATIGALGNSTNSIGAVTVSSGNITAVVSGNVGVTGNVTIGSGNVSAAITSGNVGITGNVTLGNSTANIGNVTSVISAPTDTPTLTTSAYSSGYVLGGASAGGSGLRSFTVPNTGIIQDATMVFGNETMTSQVDIILLNAALGNTSTFVDHGNLTIAPVDAPKVIGVLHVSDYTTTGPSVGTVGQALNQAFAYGPLPASGTTLYAVAVTRGAVTPAGASDLTVTINVVK